MVAAMTMTATMTTESADLASVAEALPELRWDEVERVDRLEGLLAVEAVILLREALMTCGFPRISTGWTAGSPMVSMTLKRALRSQQGAQEDAERSKESKKMDAQEQVSSDSMSSTAALARAVQLMLCRAPADQQPDAASVNGLIEAFARRTGVALCHVQWNPRSQAVRAVFGSVKVVDDRLSGRNLWRYSPSYQRFFSASPPRTYLGNVAEEVAREVSNSVWKDIADAHYFVDPGLREAVGSALLEYVAGGIQGPGEAFEPSTLAAKTLTAYLHGGAGVGKSTFVELVGRALESGLCAHVNPSIRVNVVKVPVNSMRPEHLQHILRIQGISDWSVERMVEQSIAKEHVAILHLEEHPEDETMQRQVYDLVQGMVDHLVSKYPDRRGHIIFAWTSNYAPCEHMRGGLRVVVPVKAPDADAQFRWACEMLRGAVCARVAPQVVQIDVWEDARPAFCHDMRPLNSWWRSLSFFVARVVDASGGAQDFPLSLSVREAGSTGSAVKSLAIMAGEKTCMELTSQDAFFHCPREMSALQAVLQMGVHGFCTPTVVFVDLSASEEDRETAGAAHLASLREALCEEARSASQDQGDVHVRVRDLGMLADESDKEKIYGDASEIRGGLYQFIDDTNNPNVPVSTRAGDCVMCGPDRACSAAGAATRPVRLAAVTARVTRVGQFMLRELLETSARSRTHRFSVSKRHVVFFLVALPGEPLSEQARSRAHLILSK